MGEIFRRETASDPQDFTGERLTSAINGQVQIEHYHRYMFARALCRDTDVLDIASGEGYGSAMLAQVARSVVGVEYDETTVRNAIANFRRPNLSFLQGDARAIPLPDASVGCVVSFETLEHFAEHEVFLREVKRVLRPGGCLIISTPDRDVYSPANVEANPYHVRELTSLAFESLLLSLFPHVRLMAQRAIIGSALLPLETGDGNKLVFERRGNTHFEACEELPRAPYLMAVASDSPVPPLPSSLYVVRGDLDTDVVARAGAEAALVQAQTALAAIEEAQHRMEAALSDALRALADETARNQQLTLELETMRGSARTFLRGYLPRLKKHVAGAA